MYLYLQEAAGNLLFTYILVLQVLKCCDPVNLCKVKILQFAHGLPRTQNLHINLHPTSQQKKIIYPCVFYNIFK